MIKIWFSKIKYFLVLFFLLLLIEPLVSLLSQTFSNIISGQVIYYREGRLDPSRWLIGDFVQKYFSVIDEFKFIDKNKRLEKVDIYVDEAKIKLLQSKAPVGHRNWQKAFLKYENNEINRIKIRLRGDNARNWDFKKKSIKIKTRKKKLFNGYRELYYLNAQDKNQIRNLIPNMIAKNMGIITPFSRLVELHLNGEYLGVYLEVYNTDELFLRKNKSMPVSSYKFSVDLDWLFYSFEHGLLNPYLWSRQSKNNMDEGDDRPLLINFLNKFNQNNVLFKEFIDFDEWSKYEAYRLISGDDHSNALNNLKLFEDNHKGKISNILWDPIIDYEKYDESYLTRCNYSIPCKLLEDPLFRYKRMKFVYQFIFEERVYEKTINQFKNQEEKISNSLSLDRNRLQFVENSRDFLKDFFLPKDSIKKEISKVYSYLNYNLEFFKGIFNKPLQAKWFQDKNIIRINLDGFKPITNLIIKSKKKIDNAYYDVNSNGIIDDDDYKLNLSYKNNKTNINIVLFSKKINSTIKHKFPNGTNFIPTTHNIILDTENDISSIYSYDEFRKFNQKINNSRINSDYFHENQFWIYKKIKPFIISEDIKVSKNLVFDKPVQINAGVTIFLENNASIIFKNNLQILGNKNNPVKFIADSDNNFGTIAIVGNKSANSIINHTIFKNGSGAMNIENIDFISMFSLNDTNNVKISNVSFENNKKFDDLIHIIYSNNIKLQNVTIKNANLDAIDIDLSEVEIKNLNIRNAGNDCLDLMTSKVKVVNSKLKNCGDKGVSVGEDSKLELKGTEIEYSKIGIEVKDNSEATIAETIFNNNDKQINSYTKNWMYGMDGANIYINDCEFISSSINKFKTVDETKIQIVDSTFEGGIEKSENVNIK